MYSIRRWIGIFIVVLVASQIAGRVAMTGGAAPASDSEVMRGEFSETVLENSQRQACWHGLCPGQINVRKAAGVLNGTAFLRPLDSDGRSIFNNMQCWRPISNLYYVCLTARGITLDSISLVYYNVPDLVDVPLTGLKFRLGDLVTAWGTPLRIEATYCNRSRIIFRNNIEVVYPWTQRRETHYFPALELNPTLPQTAQIYLVARESTAFAQSAIPWPGFIRTDAPIACGTQ